MIVTCARTNSAQFADHQRGRFTDVDEQYPLTLGASYVVLGMGIWETVLHVLVRDDEGNPNWCPLAAFDCARQRIPTTWEFATREGLLASGRDIWTRWVAQWGYPELVRDPAHSDALMERDPAALATWLSVLAEQENDHQ